MPVFERNLPQHTQSKFIWFNNPFLEIDGNQFQDGGRGGQTENWNMPIFEWNLPLLTPNTHTQNRFDSTESKCMDRQMDRRMDIACDDIWAEE
jgi:hypothetical protein